MNEFEMTIIVCILIMIVNFTLNLSTQKQLYDIKNDIFKLQNDIERKLNK